jgi:hypothetical protein
MDGIHRVNGRVPLSRQPAGPVPRRIAEA